MKVIIDRFEGNFAVVELEDKTFANLPFLLSPTGAKEGDVISISIDKEETERRRHEADELFNKIRNV